jgi:hypothetical protein
VARFTELGELGAWSQRFARAKEVQVCFTDLVLSRDKAADPHGTLQNMG